MVIRTEAQRQPVPQLPAVALCGGARHSSPAAHPCLPSILRQDRMACSSQMEKIERQDTRPGDFCATQASCETFAEQRPMRQRGGHPYGGGMRVLLQTEEQSQISVATVDAEGQDEKAGVRRDFEELHQWTRPPVCSSGQATAATH